MAIRDAVLARHAGPVTVVTLTVAYAALWVVLLVAIGAWGMGALAAWSILARWQSVVPAPLRSTIRAVKDAPVVRQVRSVFGGYDRWRQLHRLTGVFVAAAFLHGLLDGSP